MANERDVLYRLSLDGSNVIDGLDRIISKFAEMESSGLATIRRLGDEMKQISGASKVFAQAATQIAKSTGLEAEAATKNVKARKEEASVKEHLAAVDKQIARATQDQMRAIQQAIAEEAAARKRAVVERQLETRQVRQVSAELSRNRGEVLRLIKLYPQVEHAIRRMVDQHGSFTFTLGTNRKALNAQEQEVRDLIALYPQLAREIERVAQSTRISQREGLTLQATPTRFRAEREAASLTPYDVRQVSFALEQLGLRGAGVAGQLASVFGPVGLAVAGIGLAAAGAVRALLSLADAGAQAFAQMIKDSVEVAANLDSIEASFTGIFGSENAGVETMKQIREASEGLGVDLDEIVRKSLPFVRSLEDALTLGEFAVGLGQLDPKQGVKGATRVLQDALVGNLQPLRRTFAINTDEIEKAQEELGDVQGLLVGLEKILRQRGLDFDTLANTWVVAGGRMQQVLRTLQAQLGEPIVDTLIENFNELFELSQERRGELLIGANAIGQAVADIADFVLEGIQGFLEDLDEEKVLRFANSVSQIGLALEGMLRVLVGGDIQTGIDAIVDGVEKLAARGEQFIQLTGSIKAVYALLTTPISFDPIEVMKEAEEIAAETGRDFNEVLKEQIELAKQAEGPFEAFDRIIEETADEILRYRAGVEASTQANKEFADSVDDVGQAARDLRNAQLALEFDTAAVADAEDELEEFLEENKDITEDYIADREKSERDLGDKLEDATTKRNRDLLDLEEEASEKRLDAIRKNQRAIDDIFRKNQNALRDASLDFSDKEQDILRKNARKLQEIEEESTKERIKIEEDFQEELLKLRRKFEFDKQEAIRKNDAIAFLELKRRFEFELKEAQVSRDKEQSEEEKSVEEKRLKAKQQLEEEIEDAQIANQRKLRDLQLRLEDELEAQRIKHQRELQDIAIFEARKAEEIDKAFKRSVEDIRKTFDRRIRELEIAYDREIAVVRAKEAELTAVLRQAKAQQSASLAQYNALVAQSGSISLSGRRGGRGPRGRPGPRPDNVPSVDPNVFLGLDQPTSVPNLAPGVQGRQHGGFARARQPILVGEPFQGRPNPEIVIPSADSLVVPLRKLMFSPPRSSHPRFGGLTGGRASVSIDMVDPTKVSPEVRFQMLQMIQQVVAQAMTRARHG